MWGECCLQVDSIRMESEDAQLVSAAEVLAGGENPSHSPSPTPTTFWDPRSDLCCEYVVGESEVEFVFPLWSVFREDHFASKLKFKSMVCSLEQMLRCKFSPGVRAGVWETTIYHSFLSFVFLCSY